VMDRLIRITTALAVGAVAIAAAIISYQHAYELVRSHGESGLTGPAAVRSRWTASFGLRPWWYSMPAAGTSQYHGWRRGACSQYRPTSALARTQS
jgi:hypothetical protein